MEVQRRISLYWDRESTVLYPPIDNEWFDETSSNEPWTKDANTGTQGSKHEAQSSKPPFLIVSTLVPYKRIDLAVEACTRGGIPLLIAGSGPDLVRLKRMAGPTVKFLGYVQDEEKRNLYTHARAVIFPGHEDFGLVPLESLACGTPVIAYGKGGALETIVEGVTGTFFHEQTVDSLLQKILTFDHNKYSKQNCVLHAGNFRESKFVQQLFAIVGSGKNPNV